jgi:hypothetical protein
MNDQQYYRIQVRGHLSSQWDDWFGGLVIENMPDGDALLHGELPDEAALHGVLGQLRDLGLELLSLRRTVVVGEADGAQAPSGRQVDRTGER